MKNERLYVIAAFVALLMTGLAAPDVRAQDDAKAAMKGDKTGTNPVNFTNDMRLYNEFLWLNTRGDGEQNITTFEFRTPFADGKWQFRARARVASIEADTNGDGSDDIDDSGFLATSTFVS